MSEFELPEDLRESLRDLSEITGIHFEVLELRLLQCAENYSSEEIRALVSDGEMLLRKLRGSGW